MFGGLIQTRGEKAWKESSAQQSELHNVLMQHQ
jgi:hypothetical protein